MKILMVLLVMALLMVLTNASSSKEWVKSLFKAVIAAGAFVVVIGMTRADAQDRIYKPAQETISMIEMIEMEANN